jgi:hypothetical protein
VPNDDFPEPCRYAGEEKYRKVLVSLRRAEYRFCSFVAAAADDGVEDEGEIYGPADHTALEIICTTQRLARRSMGEAKRRRPAKLAFGWHIALERRTAPVSFRSRMYYHYSK